MLKYGAMKLIQVVVFETRKISENNVKKGGE